MKITEMIKKLGGHRATIAKQAGISEQSLNNLVSQKREVLELLDGRFIVVSKQTVVFGEVDYNNHNAIIDDNETK